MQKIVGLINPYQIFKCKKCKVYKINPYVSNEKLLNLYNFEYYNKSSNVNLEK